MESPVSIVFPSSEAGGMAALPSDPLGLLVCALFLFFLLEFAPGPLASLVSALALRESSRPTCLVSVVTRLHSETVQEPFSHLPITVFRKGQRDLLRMTSDSDTRKLQRFWEVYRRN